MKKVALASLLAIATSTLFATPFALAQAAAAEAGCTANHNQRSRRVQRLLERDQPVLAGGEGRCY